MTLLSSGKGVCVFMVQYSTVFTQTRELKRGLFFYSAEKFATMEKLFNFQLAKNGKSELGGVCEIDCCDISS